MNRYSIIYEQEDNMLTDDIHKMLNVLIKMTFKKKKNDSLFLFWRIKVISWKVSVCATHSSKTARCINICLSNKRKGTLSSLDQGAKHPVLYNLLLLHACSNQNVFWITINYGSAAALSLTFLHCSFWVVGSAESETCCFLMVDWLPLFQGGKW